MNSLAFIATLLIEEIRNRYKFLGIRPLLLINYLETAYGQTRKGTAPKDSNSKVKVASFSHSLLTLNALHYIMILVLLYKF